MDCRPPLLAGLRRSLLGAWLACAYGLAVLAVAFAPATAQAHPPFDGALLCSGLAVPGQDAPETGGEPSHCKGCPVNPVFAAPAEGGSFAAMRTPVHAELVPAAAEVAPGASRFGLPQSRGPPGA